MEPNEYKPKTGLDKDLKKITSVESAVLTQGQSMARIGLGLLFLIGVWVFASMQTGIVGASPFVIVAAVIGGYMALNIGANDVANNVGPAVGSKALTLFGAIIIAAIFESGGAILAGGDVISTIKKGIIDPSFMPDAETFMTAMMAALLAAALWLNLATYVGAPVSTTHSIVGGVMGAGIAATGFDAVNWVTVSKIAASWIISPLMGGIIAAGFLLLLKVTVLNKEDKIAAARRWVPIVVAIMAATFTVYLMSKGIKKLYESSWSEMFGAGAVMFIATWAIVRARVIKRSADMENRKKSVNKLFVIPLIFSAALLSFAHGANDVANAVGPLAAIVAAADSGEIMTKAGIPLWVMLVGALGISMGLLLFGPKLIRKVGSEITKLNPVRAFCVALAAAITVIIASALGLPVSSTHIAVGGVFGVGFLREYLAKRTSEKLREKMSEKLGEKSTTRPSPLAAAEAGIEAGAKTVVAITPELAHELVPELTHELDGLDKKSLKKKMKKSKKRKLVRRNHVWTIAAAWIITVPIAAVLAGVLFLLLMGLDIGA